MPVDKTSNSFEYILSEDNEDIDLVASFQESFPELDRASTKDQILFMVNINAGIRDWYFKYKQYRSTFLVKPDWLPNDKESLEDWAKLKDKLASQKKLFREWDTRIESKSKALKVEIDAVAGMKSKYMKELDPLLVIDSLTVNNLSARDALDIALEGDIDLRTKLMDEKVRLLKESYYAGYKNGNFTNPYLK
jgi:hypothetical protein